MEEVLRSLALFRPEMALTVGLLLVVVVDSVGGGWRNAAVRVLSLSLPAQRGHRSAAGPVGSQL